MDPAVALWVLIPLAAVHVLAWWQRPRHVFWFQIGVDLLLAAFCGRILATGEHIGPGVPDGETWGAPVHVAGSPEQSDLPLQFAVWWEEVRRLAAHGEPPWISDRIGGGVSLYAGGQSGLPFPLQAPVWTLGAERGTDVMAAWKLELAALGGFLLLRRWRLRPAAAAAGALSYAFGLYEMSWLVVPLAWVVAAAPWVMWALVATLRGSRRAAAGLALMLGMLAGWSVHPESAVFLSLAVAGAGIILAWGRWRRLARLAAPFALAVAVAGVGALPTLAAISDSAKLVSAATATYPMPFVDNALRAKAVALLAVPWREGAPMDGTWSQPFANAAVAVGVGTAALCFLLVAAPRRRHRRVAAAMAAIGAGAAILVWQVPGVAQVLGRVPGLSVMTWSRAGFLVSFAIAVLAALAVDAWLRRPQRARFAITCAVFQLLVALLVITVPEARMRSRAWRGAWVPGVLAVSAPLAPLGGGIVLPLAVAGGALAEEWDLLPSSRARQGDTVLAAELRRHLLEDGGRLVGTGSALEPNLAARWGAADLRDHDPMRPRELAILHEALGCGRSALAGPLTRPCSGLLGAWGVRWLVTPPEGIVREPCPGCPGDGGWDEVYAGPTGRLYRNRGFLPVIRLVGRVVDRSDRTGPCLEGLDFATMAVQGAGQRGQPDLPGGATGTLDVLEDRPAVHRVRVATDGEMLAVLHVPRAPGWTARLDGRHVPILTVDLAAMGARVPAGTHVVSWTYSPPLLLAGVALTLVGLSGCCVLAFAHGRRRA